MRRFIKICLILLVLLIAAAIAVPFLIPADTLKARLLEEIQARTGRTVTMGHASISLFPTLGLSAEDVTIGNPEWVSGGNLAEIKTLKVGIELIPLLHGEYRLKDFSLENPVIALIKQQGRTNWDFSKSTQATNTAPGNASPAAKQANSKGGKPTDLHLDNISITNGTLSYKDGAANKSEIVTGINLSLKAPSFNEKADITFNAVYEGKKADIDLKLVHPLAFAANDATQVALKASYGPYDFTWAGEFQLVNGSIPKITGAITIPSLNTADLSPKQEASSGTASAPAAAPAPRTVQGAAHWSDTPIKLDGLRSGYAKVTVSIGKLILPKTTLENINVSLSLAGGQLLIQTNNALKAYGGSLSMNVGLNANGTADGGVQVTDAEAEPFLHDFASYDRLSGTITTHLKFSTSGTTQRALISALSGSGGVTFKNGKLKGVNIAALLKNPTAAGAQGEESSTDFSQFSGTYTIAKGIVTTNDLKLSSQLLTMTGAGTADLPNWEEHFLLKPMLVASQAKDGKDASGITIPVAVDGPLDHPQYKPDLQAALEDNLKDPKQLERNVKGIKNQLLQGGKLNGDALKGLLR